AFVIKNLEDIDNIAIRKSFMFYTDATFVNFNIDEEDDIEIKSKEEDEHLIEFYFKNKSGMGMFIKSQGIRYIASSDYENRIYIVKPKKINEEISTAHIIGYKDNEDGVSIFFIYDGCIYANHLSLIVDMNEEKYTTRCFKYLERLSVDIPFEINNLDIDVECLVKEDNSPDIFMYLGAYNSFNIIKDNKVIVSYSEDKGSEVAQGYVAYDFTKGILFDVD
ncbi:MAG: hypothetical protein ACRCWM_02540, partial [Sarcina sp.]